MRDKNTVFFIETNFAGNGCKVMQIAQDRGYKTHFLTSDTDRYNGRTNPHPCDIADDYSVVDCADISKLLFFFEGKKEITTAVLAFDDFRLLPATIIANYLNLPSPTLSSILSCRYKPMTRELTNKSSHKKVNFSVVDFDQKKPTHIQYPCIVKPCDESGSVGVSVCTNDHEFDHAMMMIKEQGANSIGYTRMNAVLVEQYIDGNEFSAEVYWDHQVQQWKLIGLTRKYVSEGQYRVEIGHTFPFHPEPKLYKKIESTICSWLSQISLKNTVAHVEFKIHKNDIFLIEVNPRIAGDNIADLVQFATSLDIFELFFLVSLQLPLTDVSVDSHQFASVAFLIPEKEGIISEIKIDEQHSQMKANNLRTAFPISYTKAKSASYRLGNVICCGVSEEESFYKAQQEINNLEVIYQ